MIKRDPTGRWAAQLLVRHERRFAIECTARDDRDILIISTHLAYILGSDMDIPPSTPSPARFIPRPIWHRFASIVLLICLGSLGLWAYQLWGFGLIHILVLIALIFNINPRTIVRTLRENTSISGTTADRSNDTLLTSLRTPDQLTGNHLSLRWRWFIANLLGGVIGAALGAFLSLRLIQYRTTNLQVGTFTHNTLLLWSAGVGCLFLVIGIAQMIVLWRYLFNPGFWIVAYSFGGIFIAYLFQQIVARYAWPWGEWGSITLGMLVISLMQYRIALHTPQSIGALWWPLLSTVCGSSIGLVLILSFGSTMEQPIDLLGWIAFWGLFWLGYGLGTMGSVVRWVQAIRVPSEAK
jgi:hypothetical protein